MNETTSDQDNNDYGSSFGQKPDHVLLEHLDSYFTSNNQGPKNSQDDDLGPLLGTIDLDFSASPLGDAAIGLPVMKDIGYPVNPEKLFKLGVKDKADLDSKQEKRKGFLAIATIQEAVMQRISMTVKQVFDEELEIFSELIAVQPPCDLREILEEMLAMDTELPNDDEVHDQGLLHARSVEFQNMQTRLDWLESKVSGFILLREEASEKLSEIAYNLFDGNTIPERKANATTLLLPITRGLSLYKSMLGDIRNVRRTLRDGQERLRSLLINKQAEMKYSGSVNEGNNYLLNRAAQRAEQDPDGDGEVNARSLRNRTM